MAPSPPASSKDFPLPFLAQGRFTKVATARVKSAVPRVRTGPAGPGRPASDPFAASGSRTGGSPGARRRPCRAAPRPRSRRRRGFQRRGPWALSRATGAPRTAAAALPGGPSALFRAAPAPRQRWRSRSTSGLVCCLCPVNLPTTRRRRRSPPLCRGNLATPEQMHRPNGGRRLVLLRHPRNPGCASPLHRRAPGSMAPQRRNRRMPPHSHSW